MTKIFLFLLKTLLPLGILAGGFFVFRYLMATGPEPQKRPSVDRTPVVEVQDVKTQDYTVTIAASGIVRARTQTNLVAEVAGKVIEVSPDFKPGGYVDEGSILLKLDDTDHQDAIAIAKANIAADEAALAQLNQEERNTLTSFKLANATLKNVQENLNITRQNMNNVRRRDAPVRKNTGLIQRNLNLARQNYNLTKRNLGLAQRNLALARKELARQQNLAKQGLIPLNQADAQQQQVLQLQQQIVQQEQSLVQQQQAIVQQEQQLNQQDQSLVQQDENVLNQQQRIVQQQQALNQQRRTVAELQGQLATYKSRRQSRKANITLRRTELLRQQRNLERTIIRAPYTGRILEQRVDVGQFVSNNAALGSMYATDYVEVELPLSLEQYALLDLQDNFRGEKQSGENNPAVTFSLPFGNNNESWQGQVTGTRASLNEQSRQVTVVARIDDPYERNEGQNSTLKIGQFLNAFITGRTFKEVYVLPPVAVRQNREILLMRDNQVAITPVQLIWSAEDEVVVRSETALQDPVILTSLGQAINGMRVALPGQKRPPGRPGGGGRPGSENASLRDVPEKPDTEAGDNAPDVVRTQEKDAEVQQQAKPEEG